jgi:hypothetical protein
MRYYHPVWFDKYSQQKFVEDIFRELKDWTSDIGDKFEFPVGYGERPLGGHLALAAYNAGFPYTLQEYVYEFECYDGKQGSNGRRPDLYMKNRIVLLSSSQPA